MTDADAIARLRQRIERAESAGDAEAVVALMTDDVVAMVPTAPVIEGRAACGAFVRQTLRGLLEVFERAVRYRADEVAVFGDVACERGTFWISCVSRENGAYHDATGKYFWLLRREDGEWRIARLMHTVDELGDKGPEMLSGPRLRLVRPRLSDVPEMFEGYASDPEVTRYLSWPRHRVVADTEAFIAFSDAEWARAPAGPYLIRSTVDDRLLGSTGLAFNGPHRASTGYVLARHAWGKGYATDVLSTMAGLAGALGVSRLEAVCHADHAASRRVLEKGGFTIDESASPRAEFPNLDAGVPHRAVLYVLTPTPPVEEDS